MSDIFTRRVKFWTDVPVLGQAGNKPSLPAKMQSKMDEVKSKVMEQGEKQKQANQ